MGGNPPAFVDHQQKHQMRFHESTKDVGIRRLFHQSGYKVYLIAEYRTSCRLGESRKPVHLGELRSPIASSFFCQNFF